jgi:hypothetical protein
MDLSIYNTLIAARDVFLNKDITLVDERRKDRWSGSSDRAPPSKHKPLVLPLKKDDRRLLMFWR